MSLRKSLKTYLIVAVMLVMGGMAVKTVGIADESGDSYTLTIKKEVTGIPEGEAGIYNNVEYTFNYKIDSGEEKSVTVKAGGEPVEIPDIEGSCTVTITEVTDGVDTLEDYKLEIGEIKYSKYNKMSGNVTLSVNGKVDGTSVADNGIYVGDGGKIIIGLGEQTEEGKSYLYRILDDKKNPIDGKEGGLSGDKKAEIEGLNAGRYYVEMAEKPGASQQPSPASDLPTAGSEEGAGTKSIDIVSPKEPDAVGTGKTGSEKEEDTEKTEEEKSETQIDSDEDDASKTPEEEILDEEVARASFDDVEDGVFNSDNVSDFDGDDAGENGSEDIDTDKADETGNEEDNLLESDINANNESDGNDIDENISNVGDSETETENGIMPMSSEGEEEELKYIYTNFKVSYEYKVTGNKFNNIDYLDGVEVTVDTEDLPVGSYQVTISGGDIKNESTFEKKEGEGEKPFNVFAGYSDENPLPRGTTYQMKVTDGREPDVLSSGKDVTVTLGGKTKHINLICSNPYKKVGTYNVVHEYYLRNSDGSLTWEGNRDIEPSDEEAVGTTHTEKDVSKILEYDGKSYTFMNSAYGTLNSENESNNLNPGNDTSSNDLESKAIEENDTDPRNKYNVDESKEEVKSTEKGDQIIILKYERTDSPKKDPKDPDDPDLPDPNDPESPPTITITDDDVPRTYVRVWDPQKGEWVYLPEDEVPLAGRTSPRTADNMAPAFWMFMTGLSVAGVGAFYYNKKKNEE